MMAQDRESKALGQCAEATTEHKSQPEQITVIIMDMSPAYIAAAIEHFPEARVVFRSFYTISRP
jgi:transposase